MAAALRVFGCGAVDFVGEVLDELVEAFAELAEVAGGCGAFEVAPAGVDVVDVVAAGSWCLRVGADGGGVDVVAVGDLGPGPGAGQAAFALAPVGVGHEAVVDELSAEAVDEVLPSLGRDLPGGKGGAAAAVVDEPGG